MTVGDVLSVIGIVTAPFLYVYQLREWLLQSTFMTGVYSAAILVVMVVRFVLMPIVGSLRVSSGASDTVKSGSGPREHRGGTGEAHAFKWRGKRW